MMTEYAIRRTLSPQRRVLGFRKVEQPNSVFQPLNVKTTTVKGTKNIQMGHRVSFPFPRVTFGTMDLYVYRSPSDSLPLAHAR